MIRAICAVCNIREWFEAIKGLDWDIVYWVANKKWEKEIRKSFPNAIYQDIIDARFAVPAYDIKTEPLDMELLNSLSKHEGIVYRMMDGFHYPYHYRVRLYHKLLRYWLAVLRDLKPDVVLFPVSPHSLFDYVIYILAKHLGIQTIMFQFTSLGKYILPISDIEKGTEDLRNRYHVLLAEQQILGVMNEL